MNNVTATKMDMSTNITTTDNTQDTPIHDCFEISKTRYWIVHGWILWSCWSVLGLAMIITTRYLKQFWKLNLYIHIVVGSSIFITNIIYGLGAICLKDWKVSATVHGILGTIFSIAMFFTSFIGGTAHFLLRNIRWQAVLLQRVNLIHKVNK